MKPLYIELDPETDAPALYAGKLALQRNGARICDGLTEQDAQDIVRAVNAHDALVDALREVIDHAQIDMDDGAIALAALSDIRAAARDALTLATGEQS